MNISVSRRQFLSYSFYSGALLIAAPLSLARAKGQAEENDPSLTPLVKIHSDNSITYYCPSPEMGQGVDTSLAMLFMEELDADMDLVSVEPLPFLLKKDAEGKISFVSVPQFAGGSTSIVRNWPLLREAGASAKQLLLLAAAKYLQLPLQDLSAHKSFIFSKSGQKISFGALAELAALEELPADFKPELKTNKDWHTIGKSHHSKQAKQIVTGQPLYTMDMDYPGVKIALIARSPYLDGFMEAVDASAAKALPGVHAVVELPRPALEGNYTYLAAGVAVIADDFWTAKKARELLKITWNKGPHHAESTQSLNAQCQSLLAGKGQIVRDDGDYTAALASADKVISHTYQLPLVSHATLEPQNCIAHVSSDNCTVIGPMQSPGSASRFAEQITGFDRTKMDIRYSRLGGGFGRRLTSDYVAEAITISKLSGLPVKLIWTREDDLCHDFYRPMGHHQLTAGVDKAGKVIAWSHRLAGTPKHFRRDNVKPEELYGADMYIDDFPAALVENLQYEYMVAKSGTPQGSWRAPAHTANAFVVQSFLNELALELDQDPLELRLAMLGEPAKLKYDQHGGPVFDTGRMANVLKQAAKLADWGRTMPKGRGLGIAGHFTFGGYCAQVAEVELLQANKFKVHKVYAAIDVGTVVNPEGIISQIEGGINDGLSAALGQQILVEGGKVITDNFDSYPMMRIADSVTAIAVHIVSNEETPSGVGEMGLPPTAPAVANAIVAAGGKRIRLHPMQQRT
jgi:isoquinoline 1-oxidoreductase subunit beta